MQWSLPGLALRTGLAHRPNLGYLPILRRNDVQLPACCSSADTPAVINYFASALSCTFALWTAAFTAARNASVSAGACTSPASVSRKETFLP